MTRVLDYPSLDSLEAVEGTNDQRISEDSARMCRLISLRWSHKSYCRFCRAEAIDEMIRMKCKVLISLKFKETFS